MTKFKMKQLALAVGTVLGGLSLIPSAQAVNLATDGLGQTLIYPYYTVRDGWNTLFNVTNTSDQTVAARVRFKEARNSRDVFDFTVILSPFDVWTGWVTNGANGPRLNTNDNSCTVPLIPAAGEPFAPRGLDAYTGPAADGGPTDSARMEEGYVVVQMLGSSDPAVPTAIYAQAAVHQPTGIPLNCALLRNAFANRVAPQNFIGMKNEFGYEGNPLKGTFNLVNGGRGQTAGGEAVTLANFWAPTDVPPIAGGTNNLLTMQLPAVLVPPAVVNAFAQFANQFQASFHEPTLNSANTQGQVHMPDGTVAVTPDGTIGADLVSFVLTRDTVVNQWASRTVTPPWGVNSDWVVTMPTKRYYADYDDINIRLGFPNNDYSGRAVGRANLPEGGTPDGRPDVPYPFTEAFPIGSPIPGWVRGQSCDRLDPVGTVIFNREEDGINPRFSPSQAPTPSLCTEVTIFTFGNPGGILGSNLGVGNNVEFADLPGDNGWFRLALGNAVNQGYGLPVVGFSLTARLNTSNTLSDAFLVDHAYTRCVGFGADQLPCAPGNGNGTTTGQ